MSRKLTLVISTLPALVIMGVFCGCAAPLAGPEDGSETGTGDGAVAGAPDPGVLAIKAVAESLGESAKFALPTVTEPPDDVDVNLTPSAYTVAFKRIVLKTVDEETEETLAEVEIFSSDALDDALVVDLLDIAAADVLEVEDLDAGSYNQLDIEVFYLEMTVPTIYPDSTSHDISYRMVYENMGVLEVRDFLLYLEPDWMDPNSALAASVTEEGWYWMEMGDPNHVEAVAGATVHPEFHVLDLFANDEFWSSEHKVLEGGRIEPPLEYDPNDGGVLTMSFDVTGKFNFKDYYDETTEADGLWEIRRDSGIHPFPPDIGCTPGELDADQLDQLDELLAGT